MLANPRIEIKSSSIKNNVDVMVEEMKEKGLKIIGVTKSYCANKDIIKVLYDSGISTFADSRMENLIKIRKCFPASKLFLLRVMMQSEMLQAILTCDYSAQTSLETIKLVDKLSRVMNKKHGVILMVDMGDLREGILPNNVVEISKQVEMMNNVHLIGIAVNFACFGGVLPDVHNTTKFGDLAVSVEKAIGRKLDIVSIGGTVCIDLIRREKLHDSITHIRLGESLSNGTDASKNSVSIPKLLQNTFELVAEVVEVIEKPSVPIGSIGYDAFGNIPTFVDKGIMLRAVLAIGKQDTPFDALVPKNNNIEILGGSSDHMICDVSKCPEIKVGSEVRFLVSWKAMLHLMTSRYIKKVLL